MNSVIVLVTNFITVHLKNIQLFVANLLKKLLPKIELEFTVTFKISFKKQKIEP